MTRAPAESLFMSEPVSDRRLRIDVYFDVYPHPAKPYFEAQLGEWQRQGHALRLFSFGGIPGARSAFPIRPIHTLRETPVSIGLAMLQRWIRHPARAWRVLRSRSHPLDRLKALAIDAQLPESPADVQFVHNLETAVRLTHLKFAYPQATLAIYYHGGEIPGVPQIPHSLSSLALSRADIVFSNTQASVSESISRGAHAARTACVPVGFDLERFAPPIRNHPDGRWRFACVGRMAREKGFDVTMRALAEIATSHDEFHLTLIGDGPELPALKELTDRLGLTGHVTFRGHLESRELLAELASCDVLILSSLPVPGSSWRETQACVMQEAMLMGAIVVGSDFGGIRESLPPALHPFLYAPGSTTQLAERLGAVMCLKRAELAALSRTGREFVVAHYDIRNVNRMLLAAVTRLTSGNVPSRRPTSTGE